VALVAALSASHASEFLAFPEGLARRPPIACSSLRTPRSSVACQPLQGDPSVAHAGRQPRSARSHVLRRGRVCSQRTPRHPARLPAGSPRRIHIFAERCLAASSHRQPWNRTDGPASAMIYRRHRGPHRGTKPRSSTWAPTTQVRWPAGAEAPA
jgi:hypothetical protein